MGTAVSRTKHRVSEWAWQAEAACRGTDPELFFPATDEEAGPAKQVCGGCPVRLACLAFALEREERYGVWGGLTERERARLSAEARRSILQQARRAA
jgi:WhiB family redox-sensing transcriptional regulator